MRAKKLADHRLLLLAGLVVATVLAISGLSSLGDEEPLGALRAGPAISEAEAEELLTESAALKLATEADAAGLDVADDLPGGVSDSDIAALQADAAALTATEGESHAAHETSLEQEQEALDRALDEDVAELQEQLVDR